MHFFGYHVAAWGSATWHFSQNFPCWGQTSKCNIFCIRSPFDSPFALLELAWRDLWHGTIFVAIWWFLKFIMSKCMNVLKIISSTNAGMLVIMPLHHGMSPCHIIMPHKEDMSSYHIMMPFSMPCQHAMSACHIIMQYQHAMSSCHITMPCQHATSSSHIIMPCQHATSSWHIIMSCH